MFKEVEYVKTPGYLVLDGNKIMDAQLGEPAEWTENHVMVRDMKTNPTLMIGKFWNYRDRRAYLKHDGRSGAFTNMVAISHEDDKAVAVAAKENEVEIAASNLFVRFIKDFIDYGKPITEEIVREKAAYVTNQLDKYLGKDGYTLGVINIKR